MTSPRALHPNGIHIEEPCGWEAALDRLLPLYGHRNWIVVADSAYPLQSRLGITTIVADAGQRLVVEKLLARLAAAPHVRPAFYLDKELDFIDDTKAPGVSEYRRWLANALGHEAETAPHEETIARLDQAGRTFCILIIKTNMTIPYTSLFVELRCAYWDDAAENELRTKMRRAPSGAHQGANVHS